MIEESYLSYVAASITVLYIRLLIGLIGRYKKRYKYFIAQKYYNTKSSNRERHKELMRILCAEWCAWSSTESQRAAPDREVQSTEERDIDAQLIKSVRLVWAFSFNGFKSQLLSAFEESFIVLTVVTERNTQFERWTEDDRQPQRQQREEFTWTWI